LGKGGGGSCYKVIDKMNKDNQNSLALKMIENSDLDGMLEIFMNEIEVLLSIDFPLIVSVYDNFRMNGG
jgi:hypothetical protein